jgi:hypothetical protein
MDDGEPQFIEDFEESEDEDEDIEDVGRNMEIEVEREDNVPQRRKQKHY